MNTIVKDKKKVALTYMMSFIFMFLLISSVHEIGFDNKSALLIMMVAMNLLIAYRQRGFIVVVFEYFLMGFMIFMSAFYFLDDARAYGPENDLFRTAIGTLIFIVCCWSSSALLEKTKISS